MTSFRGNSASLWTVAALRRIGGFFVAGLLLTALASAQSPDKISKYDEASAKKLAAELLSQVQQGLKAGEDAESCYSKFSLPAADPLHKSLAGMSERHIKDVELFDEGAYLEMKLVGESRSDKVTVMVRLADDKCVSFEASKD